MPLFIQQLTGHVHGPPPDGGPALVWLHVAADTLIAVSYFTIPFTLLWFVRRRRDLPFNWMFVCFATFIVACGLTHVMGVWTVWVPDWWLSGGVKVVTAVASIGTAVALVRLVPHALVLPSPTQLAREVEERRRAEGELRRLTDELEQRVESRTRELRRREDEYRRTFESDAAGNAQADPVTGRFTRVNRRYCEITGYTAEELLDRTVADITHPDDRGRDADGFRRLASGEIETYESVKRYQDKRGRTRWGHVFATLLRDDEGRPLRVYASVHDVTGERSARQALVESEARLRRVVESNMLGIGFWRGGVITEANHALLALLGRSAGELAAGTLRLTDVTPSEFAAADERARREIAATGSCQPYEKELLRADGSRVPVLAGGAALPEEDSGVFFALDLSERRRAQAQVEAAQRMEVVGRLAGGAAHEINNALQGVVGFSALALRRIAPHDPVRDDVEQVLKAGERAAVITEGLLAFSRRQVLHPADVDLARLVRNFAPMLRQAIGPDKALELQLPDVEVVVHADPVKLEQVLLNLAINARDAMREGGRLTVRVAERNGRGPLLEVADTGTGIPEATLARIFDPFFTTKPPGQGTGLGLSVVQGIVEQSGGTIGVESAPGKGTRFRIHLPVSRPAALPVHPALAIAPRPGSGRRVLVVDDERMVRQIVARVLEGEGYQVLESEDGAEALARLEQECGSGCQVHLVITDVVMPGMGGRALREAVARRWPALPVLYISGFPGPDMVRQGLIDEDATVLQKPFVPERLAALVGALLDGARTPLQPA